MIDFPSDIRAGTTYSQRIVLTAYPADEWTLRVRLRGAGAPIDLVGVADGVTHVLSAPATTTAGWAPGIYAWAATLDDGMEVVDAGGATVRIVQDLATVTGVVDARSHAERTLALIELAIEGRIPKDQESYKIGQRELVRIPIADLVTLRSRYRAEVARERRARAGFGSLMGQHVRVRF